MPARKAKRRVRNGVGWKTCTECEKWTRLADFSVCDGMNDGHASVCKACNARRQRKRRKRLAARTSIKVPAKKRCPRCRVIKSSTGFYSNRYTLQGLDSCCKLCRSHEQRAVKYGMTRADYAVLVEASGGRCAICHRPFSGPKEPAIDHDHETGKIRGLLCKACNCALGYMEDTPERLEAAANYLREHSQ